MIVLGLHNVRGSGLRKSCTTITYTYVYRVTAESTCSLYMISDSTVDTKLQIQNCFWKGRAERSAETASGQGLGSQTQDVYFDAYRPIIVWMDYEYCCLQ